MRATVEIEQTIEVEIPDTLLTGEFMAEFRMYFYPFTRHEQHFAHLAQLHARGLVDNASFIEGYGQADEIGIRFVSRNVTRSDVTDMRTGL